jgi:serine/threonine-protein kinase HipA
VLDSKKFRVLKSSAVCLNEEEIGVISKVQKLDLIEYYGVAFEYKENYLKNPEAFAISPDLPLESGIKLKMGGSQTFGIFQDSSSDKWGRSLIRQQYAGEQLDEYEYLVYATDFDRQGAIRIKNEHGKYISEGRPAYFPKDEKKIVSIKDLKSNSGYTSEQIKFFTSTGTSVGGAAPKISVIANNKLFIAKLGSVNSFISNPAWEAVALDLAKQCKLNVENFYYKDNILFLERFDRLESGKRVPYISGYSLMNINESEIFKPGYTKFAKKLAEIGAQDSLPELFSRVVFTLLIQNSDDHYKNHGLLRINGNWELSPLFDVSPSLGELEGSTAVDRGTGYGRNILTLLENSKLFGLSDLEGTKIIKRIADITANWRETAQKYISKDLIELRSKAFENVNRERVKELI